MKTEVRTGLSPLWTLLLVLTLVGFSFRFLPYWKEQYEGWLYCLWGANAVLPLLMLTVSQAPSLVWGYALPFAGLLVSDLMIQAILLAQGLPASSLSGRLAIYGIFAALSVLPLVLRTRKLQGLALVAGGVTLTLAGSVFFFVLSNLLVWLGSTPAHGAYYYPPTWEGLLRCYEMALPFFRNQLLGDGLFSLAFFGTYATLQQKWAWRVVSNVPTSQKTMAG